MTSEPVVTFLVLTWIEEFFNIAGPGNPAATSWMVVGIVASALVFFLVFERRTFCRYVCPLTTLIGTVGSMGTVAGFRTRDRDVCLTCTTKDCMRGGEHGFGCPWYTWPASSDSNLYCGLCSECYKACPEQNIGLYVQKPLTSVVAPTRRRTDVAWAIALLWGLVFYQQLNATGAYARLDDWLNARLHVPHYPNPVAYLGIIGLTAALTAGVIAVVARLLARSDVRRSAGRGRIFTGERFRSYFLPMTYALIPVVGADFFARQLPKMLQYAPRVVPATQHVFGFSSTHATLYNTSIVSSPDRIVALQVLVVLLGALGSVWATWRIGTRELIPVSKSAAAVRVTTLGVVVAVTAAAAVLYVLINAVD